jgi:hypothetical protein
MYFLLTPGPLRPGFNALGRADVHLPLPSTYLSVHNSSYYYVTENKAFSKKKKKKENPRGGPLELVPPHDGFSHTRQG